MTVAERKHVARQNDECEDELRDSRATTDARSLIAPDGVFSDGSWIEPKVQDPAGDVRLVQWPDYGNGYFRNKSARFLTATKAARQPTGRPIRSAPKSE